MADYCKYFERVARANKWSDEEAALALGGCLEVGSTLLDDLDEAATKSFEAIRATVAPPEPSIREVEVQRFFSLSLRPDESIEQFVSRCRNVVNACYASFAKANKELLTRDRFVHGLPIYLRDEVLSKPNARLNDLLQTAMLAYALKKKLGGGAEQKREKSSFSQSSTSGPHTSAHRGGSHTERNKCHSCGQGGHWKKDCPKKSKPKNVSGVENDKDSRPFVTAIVNGRTIRLMVDSGSERSILPASVFQPDEFTFRTFRTASGSPLNISGSLLCSVTLGGSTSSFRFSIGDVVTPVIGVDFAAVVGLVIDVGQGTVMLGEKVLATFGEKVPAVAFCAGSRTEIGLRESEIESQIFEEDELGSDSLAFIAGVSEKQFQCHGLSVDLIQAKDLLEGIPSAGKERESAVVDQITLDEVDSFLAPWKADVFTGLGAAKSTLHHIDTGDSPPVCVPSYRRLEVNLMSKARKEIQRMKALGVVRRSNSEWCSPVVLVRKKSGEVRVAIDYRKVNAVTRKDAFPMPRVDECLDQLSGSSVYSTIDCNSGYYQVFVNPDDIPKTAFRFDGELLEFTRMPFGLSSSSQTFCRMMRRLFANDPNVVVYLDDICVHSSSVAEHKQHVARVLDTLRKAGLTLNAEKCQFFRDSVDFLGFRVNGREVRPLESKIQALREYQTLRDVKALKRFVGLASYYRSLIPEFGIIAAPLFRLQSKKREFVWGSEEEKAFSRLKEALSCDVVRWMPDLTKSFVVKTDASLQGIGCLLLQEDDNGQRVVIEYASKAFSKTERNYPVIEQEAAAIMFALERWYPYLIGASFRLETDHRPLQWIRGRKGSHGKLGRWALRLEEFQFDIRHIPGSMNADADALSRSFVAGVSVREQKSDEDLSRALEKEPKKFREIDGVLFRVEDDTLLVCLPKPERISVWQKLHAELGHVGSNKVLVAMRSRFFWPKMRDDVRRWAKDCAVCATTKDFLPSPVVAPCQSHEDHTLQPMEKCSVDVIGPLPVSNGYKYVLVLIDQFTKWAEAKPVEKLGGQVLADWLKSVFARFGVPRELVLDRGSDMESAVFREFCGGLGITQKFIAAYHHQSNPVERFNRTFLNMLRSYTSQKEEKWSEFVETVLMAYRVTQHESTKVSPYEALYGVPPRLPVDMIYPVRSTEEVRDIDSLHKRMFEVRKQARENLEAAAKRRKSRYNEKFKVAEPSFKIGDRVYLRRNRPGSKLSPVFVGPFKILTRDSEVNFVIKGSEGVEKIVHANQLKLCRDDQQEFGILRKRGRPKKST